MRIITLIENLVYQQGIIAEHGLAYYIETENKKILFDTGQSDNFIKNANTLGIDLTQIDAVIISHGHYDHTGGLYPFLKLNSKAKVYIKREAFFPKYHGTERFIGIEYDPSLLDNRIVYINTTTKIDDDVYIMPDIPIKNPLDIHFHQFKIKTPDGIIIDEFNDELYLALRGNNGLSILSSCSHRGITNIIDAAVNHFKMPLNTIVGGFHIINGTEEVLNNITMYLERCPVKSLGVCHCTGVEQYAALVGHFKTKVFYNYTGFIIEAI